MARSESYDDWLARITIASQALGRGSEREALAFIHGELAKQPPVPIVVDTIEVTAFGWEPLAKSFDFIATLRACDIADLPALALAGFGPDEHAARYWNEPGAARMLAIPAMLLARMVAAERLLESDRK